jgi:hypothetical protein
MVMKTVVSFEVIQCNKTWIVPSHILATKTRLRGLPSLTRLAEGSPRRKRSFGFAQAGETPHFRLR